MSKCLKCDVEVISVTNRCPLCNSELKKWNESESIYPNKVSAIQRIIIRKVILLIALICCVAVGLLNFFLTPDIKWSLFVMIQILLTCQILSKILAGRNRVLKSIFIVNFLVCGLSIFWDIYIGFNGWSLDYVLPSLCITYGIFALVLRIVNYFAFRENCSYIYFNVALGFVPLILLDIGYIKMDVLAYLSGVLALLNLIILIIFDWSDLKEYIVKQNPSETLTEITLDSKLGENFKCSEDKREFFENEIGKTFKFKVKFQKWLKANPDKTYREAIDAYFEIQNSKEKTKIDKQFQFVYHHFPLNYSCKKDK